MKSTTPGVLPQPAARIALPATRVSSLRALAWIMCTYIVVAIGRVEDVYSWLHALPVAKIVAAVAVLVALQQKDALSKSAITTFTPLKLALAMMALATFSIVFSVLRSGSLGVIEGTVLSVSVVLVLIVKTARDWTETRILLQGLVGSAVVLGIAAMKTSIAGRAGHTSAYDPNDFAFVLVTLLPVLITFAITSRGSARLVYLGISFWALLTILKTQSRGGLLGLIAITGLMLVLLPRNRKGVLDLSVSARRTLARLLVTIVIGIVGWGLLPSSAQTRLSTITTLNNDYNANVADGGRLTIWLDTLPLIVRRPWGFGAGAFSTVDGLFGNGRYRAPHNTFLQALIELGVEGLILFLFTLGSTFRILARASTPPRGSPVDRTELERSAFSRALMIGLLGACVSGFFLSELYSQVIWIVITLSCVVSRPAIPPTLNYSPETRSSTTSAIPNRQRR